MTANELMISLGHLVATFGDKEIYIEDLPEMDIFGVDFDTGRGLVMIVFVIQIVR